MPPGECFVVMPFGRKPVPDGSGREYDFDKVYRVIIQRAIREAGMQPLRADERTSSALIHSDMFRDLRDRAVVLADLSLDNPNVFYELGIRHVMSRGGTVLMCRQGALLPFDVKLSRVVFYDFDGGSLDWEEVERVVGVLKLALQDAATGKPDSPVHALLESVMRESEARASLAEPQGSAEQAADAEPAEAYQRVVAHAWRAAGEDPAALFVRHRGAVFGLRALALLCLDLGRSDGLVKDLANHLNDGQQFRLANRLYQALSEKGTLTRGSQLAYASSYSEANTDLPGCDVAIGMAESVLAAIDQPPGADSTAAADYAAAHRRLAGLRQWRWQLSRAPADLDAAIAAFGVAIESNARAYHAGLLRHPGFLAQAHLKLLVLLRVRAGRVDLADVDGHRDAIVALKGRPDDDPRGLSYLGWFQAIALADLGAADASQQVASRTRSHDARLAADPENWEIGGRQYSQLRRFIEQYLPHLRHHSLMGRIAQELQWGSLTA